MKDLFNYVVRIKLSTNNSLIAVRVFAESEEAAITKVYDNKGFKYRESNRENYKAIGPSLSLK